MSLANKTLSSTSIYKYTELMSNSNKLQSIISNMLSEKQGAIFPTAEQMEDVFYKIRHKSFNFQAKFAVLDMFRRGIIRLVYNDKVKLTVAIPFVKYKMENGGFGVIVNISNYARINTDGTVNIDPLTLYCLMLSAAYSLKPEETVLAYNGIPELYGALFTNVLSRIVNLNLMNKDKVKFVATKFAYMQLDVSEDRASVAAAKEIKSLDKYAIEQIDLSFPAVVYSDIESLINHMRKIFPEFNNITLGIFFEKWMRTYGEGSAFAIEYMPLFVHIFNGLITNCNSIVNVKSIEKEAGKNSRKMVLLFNRIEGAVINMAK